MSTIITYQVFIADGQLCWLTVVIMVYIEKILLVCYSSSSDTRGGSARYITLLRGELTAKGHNILSFVLPRRAIVEL